MYTTLHDPQIEIGTSTPFFELNPDEYPYVTENARWLYTWKIIRELKTTVKVWDSWIPTTSFQDRENTMGVAIKNAFYSGENSYRLQSVNSCHRYHQCFFISELLDRQNGEIGRGFLNGTK